MRAEVGEGLIGGTTSTGRTAVLVGYGVKQTEAQASAPQAARRGRGGARWPAARDRGPGAPTPERHGAPRSRRRPSGARALAKPPVRKLAKDLGVDLDTRHADRRRAASSPAPTSRRRCRGAAHGAAAGVGRRRHAGRPRGRRARDADPDQGRAQDDRAGHGRLGVHGPARHRVDHRRRHRAPWSWSSGSRRDKEFRDVKVTPLLVLAKAMCLAVRRNPGVNATLGRGRPGDRRSSTTSTSASPPPPPAG